MAKAEILQIRDYQPRARAAVQLPRQPVQVIILPVVRVERKNLKRKKSR